MVKKYFNLLILLMVIYSNKIIGQVSCVPEINISSGRAYIYHNIPQDQIKADTINIFLPFDITVREYEQYNRVVFDSTITGIFKVYLPKDSILTQIVTIKKGKKNGVLIDFYNDGSIKLKAEYINDEEKGLYISYFDFGKIKRDGTYSGNSFIGKSYEYWNNHNLASETIYDGITKWGQHKVNYWDKDGNVIDKITFNSLWYPCK